MTPRIDPRVPAYLGRVLNSDGAPVGTCFQVSPGILVTAWHVVDDIGGTTVSIDALNGAGETASAEVVRVDPLHDLAVLTTSVPLDASVKGLFATDWVDLNTKVAVTGLSKV